MKNISYKNIKITNGFWKAKQDIIANVTLKAVYDRFEETHRFAALDCNWKDGDPQEEFPHVFWDSDIAKWLEGLAYSLSFNKNDALEKIADESIAKIEKNRDEHGYYNSHFLVSGERFTVRNEHELYCAGHLMEAAVAYYNTTGKRTLLDVMCKYADYIYDIFITEQSAAFTTPGHPEIELALVKLYEATGEKKYLELSKFFIDNHGCNEKDVINDLYRGCKKPYNQDEKPLRERDTADGHSVRALYLFAGMADIARIYGDKELFDACERCFNNIAEKRMYITGATGSTCHGEAFTIDYDLPNREAYAETCAAIALAYFGTRMTIINPDSKYADAVERVMYNGAISGISIDGKSFFYENPLEVLPEFNKVNISTDGQRHFPISQRKEVFDCSCCPPNVIRFISSIGDFVYSSSDDTIFVNQYINSESDFDGIKIVQETDYPVNGEIKITVSGCKKIAVRIPSWCNSFKLNKSFELEKGYAYIDVETQDEILLTLSMKPKFISANKRVHDCAGRVALTRGPVVYCLEGVDNGKNLKSLRVDISTETSLGETEFLVPNIIASGYKEAESNNLYFDANETFFPVNLKYIPYFAYENRGDTEMIVWVLKK